MGVITYPCWDSISTFWRRYRHDMETFSALLVLSRGTPSELLFPVTKGIWREMWRLHARDQFFSTWRRHQMETFSALLALCAGNSPVSGEFPAQRPVTRSFDVFFDLRLIKRLSKHSGGWWFETLSCPLWRHCNEIALISPRCFDLQ